ncbi:MAG: site-specific DNA-methyltransferase [Pirellulales bacterium]|nr:site-specific DNA-methyltransferase [Pirellulales bacterium]
MAELFEFESRPVVIGECYSPENDATVYLGDRLELLKQLPDGSAALVVTSPPYNIGKSYERTIALDDYVSSQAETIRECVRTLAEDGSLCWQVGNHIAKDSEVVPLDMVLYPICKSLGLKMRNRIVWHFEHGLHCTKRFSGRYETIIWFTKSDNYYFDLDPVRVPQKYPGKREYKGPNVGQLSGNPLGKNPSDVWILPNVKNNHVEKTIHPCQFPVELIERLVLSMTRPGGLVVDPYMGVGSALCAALRHGRRGAGADLVPEYVAATRERITAAFDGTLKTRPLGKPVYVPGPNCKVAKNHWETAADEAGDKSESQESTLF